MPNNNENKGGRQSEETSNRSEAMRGNQNAAKNKEQDTQSESGNRGGDKKGGRQGSGE